MDYVAREMLDSPSISTQGFAVSARPNGGGFYTSQDAHSEGHEGIFFVWTPDEIRSVSGGSASGLLIVSKTKQGTNDARLFMDTQALLDVVFGKYRPNQVVALKRADADSTIPLPE